MCWTEEDIGKKEVADMLPLEKAKKALNEFIMDPDKGKRESLTKGR